MKTGGTQRSLWSSRFERIDWRGIHTLLASVRFLRTFQGIFAFPLFFLFFDFTLLFWFSCILLREQVHRTLMANFPLCRRYDVLVNLYTLWMGRFDGSFGPLSAFFPVNFCFLWFLWWSDFRFPISNLTLRMSVGCLIEWARDGSQRR